MTELFNNLWHHFECNWWLYLVAVVVISIIFFIEMPIICVLWEDSEKSMNGCFIQFIKKESIRRFNKVIINSGVSVEAAMEAMSLTTKDNAYLLNGRKIGYMYHSLSKKILNACAGDNGRIIFVSASWFVTIFNSGEKEKQAFCTTLAHEIGHQTGQIPKKSFLHNILHPLERMFIRRVNEVRCDYFGTYHGLSGNIAAGIDAMKFKRERTTFDFCDLDHPSWKKRMEYLSLGKFDETLIRKIAKDIGFKKEKAIKEVIEFYRKDEYLTLK